MSEEKPVVVYEMYAGDYIPRVLIDLCAYSRANGVDIVTKSNGVHITINSKTRAEWLIRDFMRALSGEIPGMTIGPLPKKKLSPKEKANARRIKKNRKRALFEHKQAIDKALREKQLQVDSLKESLPEFEIVSGKNFDSKDDDDIYDSAILIGRVMQKDLPPSYEKFEKAVSLINVFGFSGFIVANMAKVLALHWKYGEEFRMAYNAYHGYNGDGIVNPALVETSHAQM